MNNSNNHTLAHTTWNCKYHIVFAATFRRKYLTEENVGKRVNIVEAECCPDPHAQACGNSSKTFRFLKGKGGPMIHERCPVSQYEYGNRELWCRGCHGHFWALDLHEFIKDTSHGFVSQSGEKRSSRALR